MDDAATMVKAALKQRKQALDFGRLVQCLAAGSRPNIGSFDEGPAVERAETMNAPRVVAAVKALWRTPFAGREWLLVTRAAVGAGTTADSYGALTPVQVLSSEFIEFMRPLSIIDRLDVRRVPFNTGAGRATSGSVAGFVGEGKPYPVSSMALDTLKLGIAKLGVIVPFTTELAQNSTPDAAATISADAAAATAEGMNRAFLDPHGAAVAGVSPASITYGATQIASSGATVTAIVSDAKQAMRALDAAKIPVSAATWVMTSDLFIHLATMLDATTNEPTWPDLADNGVWLGGLPVLVSGAAYGAVSAHEGLLVLVHGPSIGFADAGAIADVSVEASVELDTVPVGGPKQLTSLYQNNLVGARVTRYCNWARRRDAAVACVHGIAV